jgi:RNA polymerase sigma-70 factor, ECF subfamily
VNDGTDDQLLERAQRGDRDALDALCGREWRAVYGLAYSALGNVAEAQDVTQEAFLRALRSLPAYRQTGAPFRAYLATITRNLIRDGWRRRQPRLVDLDNASELASDDLGPELQMIRIDEQQRLRAALSTLASDHQTVLRLRIMDGLSAADAGRVMGRKPDAIRQLQHRALVALRNALAEEARI